ncbi:MAG: polysaccharide biosynthesis tyrosine autokinase [Actinomycetota bacterium]|nr:polysaccharide biosynthesis tyrosine autokinase [Actinomycetota bacterium]
MAAVSSSDLHLRDYLAVLRRRWLLLLVVPVATILVTVVLSLLAESRYRSTVEVLVSPQRGTDLVDPTSAAIASRDRDIENELALARSDRLEDRIRIRVEQPFTLSASRANDADVLALSVESGDPEVAATTADIYAEELLSLRRELAVDEFTATAGVVQQAIDDIDTELAELEAEPDGGAERELRALESRRQTLVQQLEAIQLNTDLASQRSAFVLNPAVAPDSPISPNPLRNAIAALVVGLVLGAAAALLLDYLDDTVGSKADLERMTDAPNLAVVPTLERQYRERRDLVTRREPSSPTSEAYRSLRTSIQFIGLKRPIRSVQLTSARQAEGKTTTAANLAVAIARGGQRVTLVDCDLRNPSIHRYFGLNASPGLSSVVVGDAPLEAALTAVVDVPGLRVLCAGDTPPNPAELLAGTHIPNLFAHLQTEGDVLVIDSPPILPVTDALVLSYVVDATVLVARAGDTTMKELELAVDALGQVDAKLIGTTLNDIEPGAGDRYGYRYGYGYPSQRPNESGPSGNGHTNGRSNGHAAPSTTPPVPPLTN